MSYLVVKNVSSSEIQQEFCIENRIFKETIGSRYNF